MSFHEAIKALMQGKWVARPHWTKAIRLKHNRLMNDRGSAWVWANFFSLSECDDWEIWETGRK